MSYSPLVSVLMPVHNGMPFVKKAIESILAQTYRNWRFVIVDDGSTDQTPSYLTWVEWRYPERVTIISMPKCQGVALALNHGLPYCDGDIIARMDADDISTPVRFERQLAFLLEQGVDGCGAWIQFFGNESRVMEFPTDPEDVRDLLFERTTVPHPTYFFHRRIYEEFQYDPSYEYAEDVDFLLRVTERHRLSNVPEVLLEYCSDYERCRSCENIEAQTACIERARQEARMRRKLGSPCV